tara:strand:- start:300 stop:485 length:186 start_codon:yes stop_codon:yes gene_type:complete
MHGLHGWFIWREFSSKVEHPLHLQFVGVKLGLRFGPGLGEGLGLGTRLLRRVRDKAFKSAA